MSMPPVHVPAQGSCSRAEEKGAHFGDTNRVGVAVILRSEQPWAVCCGGITRVPASLCWGQVCSTDPCKSPHPAATTGSSGVILAM